MIKKTASGITIIAMICQAFSSIDPCTKQIIVSILGAILLIFLINFSRIP